MSEMEYCPLGPSELSVSAVSLGTWVIGGLGWRIDAQDLDKIEQIVAGLTDLE